MRNNKINKRRSRYGLMAAQILIAAVARGACFLPPTLAFQFQRTSFLDTSHKFRPSTRRSKSLQMSFLSAGFASSLLGSSLESPFLDGSDLYQNQLLSYLPDDGEYLPPQTKNLVERATTTYIYGSSRQPVTLEDLLEVIDNEYKSIDVPIQIGNVTFDVSKTGEEDDEDVVEILSFAALQQLPQEITLDLLKSNTTNKVSPSISLCTEVFAEQGWDAVSFPKGLALLPKKGVAVSPNVPKQAVGPKRWLRSRQKLAKEAKVAVEAASTTRAPKRRLQTKEEFLATMEEQFQDTAPSSSVKAVRRDELLFFPNSVPLQGISLKRLRRTTKKQYAKLKTHGRAGFVAYAFFNFLLYTVGFLWQWPRVAPADPFSHSSVWVICLRKFSRVFASVMIISNMLKLLKLFSAVGLAPAAKRALTFTKNKLKVSETVASFVLVGMMLSVWAALVALPFIAEFSRLRRLVNLERAVQGYVVQPV